jgi:hypothetical protein
MLSKKAKRAVTMKHCGAHKQDGKGGAVSEGIEDAYVKVATAYPRLKGYIKRYGVSGIGGLYGKLMEDLPTDTMGEPNYNKASDTVKERLKNNDMVGAREYVKDQVKKIASYPNPDMRVVRASRKKRYQDN